MVSSMLPLGLSSLTLGRDRLVYYTPSATLVRLITTNILITYITSWVLYLSGAAQDPRMLLPAWMSIATVSDVCFVVREIAERTKCPSHR